MQGLLLVDKPAGITSFDIIRALRRQTGVRKIGHAGTLDPLASGLMLLLFGDACRRAQYFSKLGKTYLATVRLGASSATYDAEGELTLGPDRVPALGEVKQALGRFRGEIDQVPPAHSAIKVDGQRAYKAARTGKKLDLPARKVVIHKLELLNYVFPVIELRARVSSGTYIRSLAHDLGQELHVGAYLASLIRESIGPYHLANACQLDQVDAQNLPGLLQAV